MLERITLTASYKVVADKGYNTESLTVDHSGLNVRENHAHCTLQGA